MNRNLSFRVAVFLSGAAGLLLQTLWVRRLGFIFGNTTTSVSLVLGSFFFGMALGSRLFGKRIDASRSPLAVYARLELAIGAAAAAVWFVLPALEPLYIWLYRISNGDFAATNAAQIAITFVVLVVPAALMGATLPTMVRYVTRDENAVATSVGSIYATNALGAALGLVAGSFLLIELFGLSGCYAFAIALNVTAALLAFAQSRRTAPVERAAPVPHGTTKPAGGWLYGLAFATGFLGIGYEVLWIRLWAFISLHSADSPIGRAPAEMSSTYVFSFIVFLVVAGIGLGGFLAKFARRAGRSHLEDFARVQVVLGIWGLAAVIVEPLLVFDRLSIKLLEVSLIVFPMAILMGIGFPLLAAHFVQRVETAGEAFGKFYSVNTLGSCVGPIVAGLLLIPLLGTHAALLCFAVANLGLAIIAFAISQEHERPGVTRRAVLGAVAVLLITLVVPFPSRTRFAAPGSPQVILEEDNSVAHTLVLASGTGRQLVVNNHAVSGIDPRNPFGRAAIQIPAALLARKPESILVLCVGAGGSWAGTIRYDANVVAVDINPTVFRAMPLLHPPQRYQQMIGAKMQPIVGDARNFLLLDQRQYDIINIDPAPPITQPGMVNLHTTEFYRLARARLKPGGVLIQRFSGEPDSEAFYPELLRSIADVFPEITVWAFLSRGVDVIAADHPLQTFTTSEDRIEKRIAGVAPNTFLFGRAEVDEYVKNARPVTDDRPALEFNILSRLRDDRFASMREHNVRRLGELRQPFGRYMRLSTNARP
jgi:spermidine synthase